MKKILLIEDDEIKANHLLDFLKDEMDIELIIRKKSWQSGIKEIISNSTQYFLVLLDMSMPRYDPLDGDVYDEFETYAGLDIIREMKRRNISLPVFVVTGFDVFGSDTNRISYEKLENIMKDEFSGIYIGMTYFNNIQSGWKEDIKSVLTEVRND